MKRHIITLIISLLYAPSVLLAYTGEIVKSFDTPGSFTTGLTYDGEYIWLADRKADLIYCIDPANG
ncbi:MAG: PQQ-binding-like beta-propeller repeat protein, partial [Bacteroidales bacterium]